MLWTSKKLLLELSRITIWDFGFVNRVNEENKRNLVNWVNWQGYKKGCKRLYLGLIFLHQDCRRKDARWVAERVFVITLDNDIPLD